MTAHDPFESAPDAALGRLLREHLSAGDDDRFAARIRAAVWAERDSSWDVLARWARPGLAAAASLIMGLGLWLALQGGGDVVTLADAMQPAGAPTQLLAGTGASSSEMFLGSLVEGR